MRYLETYNIFEKYNSFTRVLNESDFEYLLKRYCKNFDYSDKGIYKGINIESTDYMITNPKGKERRSAWAANYYTYLFDNSPYRGEYPKRSNSLVCTTSKDTAEGYGDVYRIIPFDGAKIAVCPSSDFWFSFRKSFTNYASLDDMNEDLNKIYHTIFEQDINSDTKETFFECLNKLMIVFNDDKQIAKLNPSYIKPIERLPKSIDEFFKNLDPHTNGFELYDYNKYKILDNAGDSEVFTDSKCLCVRI